jgi:SAM-dependent methyltransferase
MLYEKKQNYLEYPDENVVVLSHRYFGKNPKNQKLLDLGFGSGNNLIYFIKKGYDCYGCEISTSSIELTKKRLEQLKTTANLSLFDKELPYSDNIFDIIVAWNSLCYNDFKSLNFEVHEILRTLKPGGLFLGTLVRENATLINWSDLIEKNTYKIKSCYPQCGAILYLVENVDQIKDIFRSFSEVTIGYTETSFNGIIHSQWIIMAKKK